MQVDEIIQEIILNVSDIKKQTMLVKIKKIETLKQLINDLEGEIWI